MQGVDAIPYRSCCCAVDNIFYFLFFKELLFYVGPFHLISSFPKLKEVGQNFSPADINIKEPA